MKIIPYNRNVAVSYAKKWALSRNPLYYNYDNIGGDCTNFVSQCLYAGCNIMNYTKTFGWYYVNPNDKSPSWTGVPYLYNFLINNKGLGPFGKETLLKRLKTGDIIQIGSNGNYYHSLILTDIIKRPFKNTYLICAHTNDAYMKNLFSYRFSIIRCIHIEGIRILY